MFLLIKKKHGHSAKCHYDSVIGNHLIEYPIICGLIIMATFGASICFR